MLRIQPIKKAVAVLITAAFLQSPIVLAQNPLWIPDTLSGSSFKLTVQTGSKSFFSDRSTPTYGYNGSFLGPTLIMTKSDRVSIEVKNQLNLATTVHWHGFHVAPENDGGPHQTIEPQATWAPSFDVLNRAGTYWYHPHGAGKTEIQIGKGLAGIIIVRDSIESALALPRRYGVDDFPLIVQSKSFDSFRQIAIADHQDSIVLVNGTIEPYLAVPKQVVRLRLLNASADRTFYFGLSDNANFALIATDGGLLPNPQLNNRLRLSTGERAEILIDFSPYTSGSQLYLKSYGSELPHGVIGADSVGTATLAIGEGYYNNPLNGTDFQVLRFDVSNSTSNAVFTIPTTLAPLDSISGTKIAAERSLVFSPDTVLSGQQGYIDGPFFINHRSFHMDSINAITYLNNTEIWTLYNQTLVAHPFHIHDVQFRVLDINGKAPGPAYQGLKDVALVLPGDTLRFITRFETFANAHIPYMYHCHLLHHEDEGMMGSFLVLDTTQTGISQQSGYIQEIQAYPNPSSTAISIRSLSDTDIPYIIFNNLGQLVSQGIVSRYESAVLDASNWSTGMYLLKTEKSSYKLMIQKP